MPDCDLLPGQPQSNGEPVFGAPWHARAFALAVLLNEQGVFQWKEWSEHLSGHIAGHERAGMITDHDSYYRVWLDALESFVAGLDRSRRLDPSRSERD